MGILSLATILQKNHFCVKYVNNEYLKHNVNISKDEKFENIIDIISYHIINLNPKVISFYTICNTYHITIILSKRIKELNPNIRIVFGGPQATLTANDTMNSCKWVDAIGIGEGEKTIINIINFLISNDVKKCKSGIVYRKDNKVINLHQENIIPDLDKLPLIDYSDILDNNNITQISLDVGRGCPFSCKFCSTKTFWKRKFRLKSCDRIIKEIMDIKKKNNNIKFFRFEHDLFTADRTKIIDFCNKILDMKINIKWSCSARIDTLDELMIEKMYTAGCREIFLGIESGSSRIQQIINKNLDLKYAFDIIEIIKKYDIFLTTSFMYGFPEEELIDVDKTLIFIIKLIRLGIYIIFYLYL